LAAAETAAKVPSVEGQQQGLGCGCGIGIRGTDRSVNGGRLTGGAKCSDAQAVHLPATTGGQVLPDPQHTTGRFGPAGNHSCCIPVPSQPRCLRHSHVLHTEGSYVEPLCNRGANRSRWHRQCWFLRAWAKSTPRAAIHGVRQRVWFRLSSKTTKLSSHNIPSRTQQRRHSRHTHPDDLQRHQDPRVQDDLRCGVLLSWPWLCVCRPAARGRHKPDPQACPVGQGPVRQGR
jgi:hypothetical protein